MGCLEDWCSCTVHKLLHLLLLLRYHQTKNIMEEKVTKGSIIVRIQLANPVQVKELETLKSWLIWLIWMIEFPSPSEEMMEASIAISVKTEHDEGLSFQVRDQPHLSTTLRVFLLTQPGS